MDRHVVEHETSGMRYIALRPALVLAVIEYSRWLYPCHPATSPSGGMRPILSPARDRRHAAPAYAFSRRTQRGRPSPPVAIGRTTLFVIAVVRTGAFRGDRIAVAAGIAAVHGLVRCAGLGSGERQYLQGSSSACCTPAAGGPPSMPGAPTAAGGCTACSAPYCRVGYASAISQYRRDGWIAPPRLRS